MTRRFILALVIGVLAALSVTAAWADPSPDGDWLSRRGERLAPPPVEIKPLLNKQYIWGVKHQYQGMNNCGPATTAIYLSNYGVEVTQALAATALKPNPKDVNVSPDQVVAYMRSQGMEAKWRVNGSLDTLLWFLSNDIPVMVEQWIPDDGGMGHYRLATGFNRERETFTFDDTFTGPDQRWPFDDWFARWDEFNPNRIFIVMYRPEQEDLVRAILGPDASDKQMWQRAEANMRARLEREPNNGRVWFALGDSLLNQDRAEEALQAYEKAYGLGLAWRYYWYQFGHFEALARMKRWDRLYALTGPVLEKAPVHEEMYYYRGVALQGLGRQAEAKAAFEQSMQINKNFTRPQTALASLH